MKLFISTTKTKINSYFIFETKQNKTKQKRTYDFVSIQGENIANNSLK